MVFARFVPQQRLTRVDRLWGYPTGPVTQRTHRPSICHPADTEGALSLLSPMTPPDKLPVGGWQSDVYADVFCRLYPPAGRCSHPAEDRRRVGVITARNQTPRQKSTGFAAIILKILDVRPCCLPFYCPCHFWYHRQIIKKKPSSSHHTSPHVATIITI